MREASALEASGRASGVCEEVEKSVEAVEKRAPCSSASAAAAKARCGSGGRARRRGER